VRIARPRPIEVSPSVRRLLEPTESVTPPAPKRLTSRFAGATLDAVGICPTRVELEAGAAGTPEAARDTTTAASKLASNKIVPSRMARKPDAMPPQAVTGRTLRRNLKQRKINRPLGWEPSTSVLTSTEQ